jgi:hypothetical protein
MKLKIFSVAAAIFLVGAFALATLGAPDQTLGELLGELDRTLVGTLRSVMQQIGLGWVWVHAMLPLLVRPSWLVPAGLGLVCIGGAASSRSSDAARGQRRRPR